MPRTSRRLTLLAAAALVSALAACTNPMEPTSTGKVEAPAERPSAAGVYMGGVG